jgi:uncharacterized membrane protein HdeD (DUF308 family)
LGGKCCHNDEFFKPLKSIIRRDILTRMMEKGLRRIGVTVSKPVLAVIAVIFGILLILFPELVGIIIGIYLIIQGVLLLTDYMEMRRQQSRI